ncbi:MAG: iron-sulfur cluster assembly accessory protein, partial [Planctomycetes bacterium]|nr:iron-sulfur cluster assembly accessory protein [Planctomycetota bacterium]
MSETVAENAVLITENAAREIRKIIEEQELDASKVRLRVGVKGGGARGSAMS